MFTCNSSKQIILFVLSKAPMIIIGALVQSNSPKFCNVGYYGLDKHIQSENTPSTYVQTLSKIISIRPSDTINKIWAGTNSNWLIGIIENQLTQSRELIKTSCHCPTLVWHACSKCLGIIYWVKDKKEHPA